MVRPLTMPAKNKTNRGLTTRVLTGENYYK